LVKMAMDLGRLPAGLQPSKGDDVVGQGQEVAAGRNCSADGSGRGEASS
jgi:hypothetical protein